MSDETIYLQLQSDTDPVERGDSFCARCLVQLREVYESNRFGHYEVYPELDHDGNLTGFVCPLCATDAR